MEDDDGTETFDWKLNCSWPAAWAGGIWAGELAFWDVSYGTDGVATAGPQVILFSLPLEGVADARAHR